MTTRYPICLKVSSKPGKGRIGLIPISVVLVIGFLISCLWLVQAIQLILNPRNAFWLWGVMLSASVLLWWVYLAAVSWRLIADSRRGYSLELTESDAVLSVIDQRTRKISTQMILLNDVSFAEYYPYGDTASIILHAPYTNMEIPLWPLGQQAQDVLDFLAGRGIRIVNIQSDDHLPGK